MKKIVVLISGSGTNLQRIIDCVESGEIADTKISLVVADRDCYGLQRAENAGIPHQLIKRGKSFSEKLEKIVPEDIDLIVLAGFLSILNDQFCKKFQNKIINVCNELNIQTTQSEKSIQFCNDILFHYLEEECGKGSYNKKFFRGMKK